MSSTINIGVILLCVLLVLALTVAVACEVLNPRDGRRTQLPHGLSDPIYFPCPTCGRPVDALNKSMMDEHTKFHADEFIRSAEAGK